MGGGAPQCTWILQECISQQEEEELILWLMKGNMSIYRETQHYTYKDIDKFNNISQVKKITSDLYLIPFTRLSNKNELIHDKKKLIPYPKAAEQHGYTSHTFLFSLP